ncbi:MAG: GNAT family N-acetyltransferase, partial [Streptococcus sp.]
TILSAGGVYENTIDRSQRYWIDLEDEDEQSQTSRMEK